MYVSGQPYVPALLIICISRPCVVVILDTWTYLTNISYTVPFSYDPAYILFSTLRSDCGKLEN
jgi:hypothetical protein